MTNHEGAAQLHEELSEREYEIYQLRVINRLTEFEIARRFDISRQRVGQILAKVRKNLPPLDYGALRRESLELHQRIQQAALDLAEREGAPVFVGKDGQMAFDQDGEPVRDYSGRIAAYKLAAEADKEIRKLHGLD